MVFPSSVPVYLDPPNWQQRQNYQQGGSSENPQLPLPAPMPPQAAAGGGSSSIRPGSMAEKARLAKLPQPEAALKCPRCESTNTKFCYFNNYSLTQPRHFCKTCRRYWTRGGALRNVPVGGGCRRNKRSKGSSSKSPVSADRQAGPSSASAIASNSSTMDMMSHLPPPPQMQLPFMTSLHHLTDYKVPEIGLNFGDIQPTPSITASTGMDMDFRMPGMVYSSGMTDQWRLQQMQQFPFLAGLEPPPGLYPFEGEGTEPSYGGGASQLGSKPSGSGVSQLAPVKMEDNQGLNLSRQYLGVPGNEQFWGTNAWTDLSGFNSSSTSHLL